MKQFVIPEMEIVKFETGDILAESIDDLYGWDIDEEGE